MDLGVGEMGFIVCGEHPLLVTRTRVSNPGPLGPLVFKLWPWANNGPAPRFT